MKKKIDFSELKKQEWNSRKNLIMDAAQRVFAVKTFDKVNMRDIAKEAGLSAGSIYTYFENQEELFTQTSLRGADNLINMFRDMAKTDKISIKDAAIAYIDFITENYEYLSMMQHSMLYGKFTSGASLERLLKTYCLLFDQLDAVIRRAAPQGKIRTYSHLFFAALNGILLSYGRFPDRAGDEALAHMRELAAILAGLFEKNKPPVRAPSRKMKSSCPRISPLLIRKLDIPYQAILIDEEKDEEKNPEENSIFSKKEDVKKITSEEFDSVMKTILSASPQKKKVKKES